MPALVALVAQLSLVMAAVAGPGLAAAMPPASACLATCTGQPAGSGGVLAAFSANGGVVLPDPPPPDAPPDVTTEAELKLLGPSHPTENRGMHVAPILQGGVGNALFQLAAIHVYAKFEADVPCVVGFFNHWNYEFQVFQEWGGHTPPGPGLNLKHVFPRIRWMSASSVQVWHVSKGGSVINDHAFKLTDGPDMYLPMPNRSELPLQMHGYFFNARHWHAHRDYVLQILQVNPAVDRYLLARYAEVALGNSVSVHVRLGYSGEPAKPLIHQRKFPPKKFYQDAFEELGKDQVYFVFADDVQLARKMMAPIKAAGYQIRFIDENVIMSLRLMAMCTHHVLTSSTLSFWGAYLDERQPTGGKTILHDSFFDAHGRGMLPYTEWIVYGDVGTGKDA